MSSSTSASTSQYSSRMVSPAITEKSTSPIFQQKKALTIPPWFNLRNGLILGGLALGSYGLHKLYQKSQADKFNKIPSMMYFTPTPSPSPSPIMTPIPDNFSL